MLTETEWSEYGCSHLLWTAMGLTDGNSTSISVDLPRGTKWKWKKKDKLHLKHAFTYYAVNVQEILKMISRTTLKPRKKHCHQNWP